MKIVRGREALKLSLQSWILSLWAKGNPRPQPLFPPILEGSSNFGLWRYRTVYNGGEVIR